MRGDLGTDKNWKKNNNSASLPLEQNISMREAAGGLVLIFILSLSQLFKLGPYALPFTIKKKGP